MERRYQNGYVKQYFQLGNTVLHQQNRFRREIERIWRIATHRLQELNTEL